jgi:hypothetical protein
MKVEGLERNLSRLGENQADASETSGAIRKSFFRPLHLAHSVLSMSSLINLPQI